MCSRIAHGITLIIVFLSIISIYYLSYDVDALKWDNAQIKGQILQIDKQDANSGTIQALITEIIKKPIFGDLAVGKTISISYFKTPIQFQLGDCIEALGYWEGFLAVDPGGDHVDFIRKIPCPSSPPPSNSCNPGPIGSLQCTGNAVRQLYQDSNCNQYWQTVDDCNRYIPSRCCQDGGCAKCGGQETYRCVNNVVQRLAINSGTEEWQVFDDCNSYNPPRQCIGGVCVKSDEPPTTPQKECDKQSCKAQNQPIGVPYNVSGIPCIKYKKCDCDPSKESCSCLSVETQEIKFKGKVVKINDKVSGSKSYTINLDQLIAGPSWSGQLDVTTIDIFADYPKWGREDAGIIEGDMVEVYGRCVVKSQDVHYVTLNGREEYYLKKVSSEGSEKPSGSKTFIIWVGDKNSKNLPGAEVSVDGVSKGTTDDKGEVHTEVSFGKHTVSAKASCGEASKDYDFSDSIDGVTVYINSCPAENHPQEECQDIKFQGEVIETGSNGFDPSCHGTTTMVNYPYYNIKIKNILSGPQPKEDTVHLQVGPYWKSDSDCSINPKGIYDKKIVKGDTVEVFGCHLQDTSSVTISDKDYYHIKKLTDKSDLVVSNLRFSKNPCKPGEEVEISFDVTNQGNADADTCIDCLKIDGTKVTDFNSAGLTSGSKLKPGESRTWKYIYKSVPALSSGHTIEACADCNNQISEEDEGNNCRTDTLTVSGSVTCNIWVGDKNSNSISGAEVFIDGLSRGATNSNGKIEIEITLGKHTILAKADCGETSRTTDFDDNAREIKLIIESCPQVKQCGKIIDFSGTKWIVKDSQDEIIGPGDNYWSSSCDNVWVDDRGRLHLKITKKGEKWYCAEVNTVDSLGYGEYKFYVTGPVDQLGKEVLGMFNFLDGNNKQNNEIDIEITKGFLGLETNPQGCNGVYSVKPDSSESQSYFHVSSKMPQIPIPSGSTTTTTGLITTYGFSWGSDGIFIKSYYGHNDILPDQSYLISSWMYQGKNNPIPKNGLKPHINLWIYKGLGQYNLFEPKANTEIIIDKFEFHKYEPLRDLAGDFLIGYASRDNFWKLSDTEQYKDTAKREFNILTPENQMKWSIIHPSEDYYNFGPADEHVTFAQENNMKVHGHCLIYGDQLPDWITSRSWTRDELINEMYNHIDKVMGRYKGKVLIWDVVNEAFDDDGTLKKNLWYNIIGPDYVELAFRRAKKADSDSKLIYNDFNIEEVDNVKSEKVYQMIKDFKNKGIPIDGIGMQMHIFSKGIDYDKFAKNMKRYADLGLETYVTEMDVEISKNPSESELENQANVYRAVLNRCLNQPACKALQMWGFTDNYYWTLPDKPGKADPLIFDSSYKPKPSYYSIQSELMSHKR